MKHTKKLLATTLILTPALLAFSLRGDAIEFSIDKGATKTKTFTNVAEFTLDDMAMLMNGQENPMMPDIEISMTTAISVTVSDEYAAVGDGQPLKLKRTFDSIEQSVDTAMEMDMMGQVQNKDTSVPASSELEGVEVLFTWDEDAADYVTSFPEEEGDEDLLEGLLEDMDLRAFLPSGEVSEDDEWEVSPEALITILSPGGNLKLVPEDMGGEDMMGMNQDMGDFSDWFSTDMEGTVLATYKGTRETDDGVKVGVIEIAIEITNAVDMTEMVQDKLSELPSEVGEMEVTSIDMAFELEGEATLLWNLSGYMHSFEMTGDFAMMLDTAMSISTSGMDMDIEQSMEFSGSMTTTATTE